LGRVYNVNGAVTGEMRWWTVTFADGTVVTNWQAYLRDVAGKIVWAQGGQMRK
jgi:hypothetical protein